MYRVALSGHYRDRFEPSFGTLPCPTVRQHGCGWPTRPPTRQCACSLRPVRSSRYWSGQGPSLGQCGPDAARRRLSRCRCLGPVPRPRRYIRLGPGPRSCDGAGLGIHGVPRCLLEITWFRDPEIRLRKTQDPPEPPIKPARDSRSRRSAAGPGPGVVGEYLGAQVRVTHQFIQGLPRPAVEQVQHQGMVGNIAFELPETPADLLGGQAGPQAPVLLLRDLGHGRGSQGQEHGDAVKRSPLVLIVLRQVLLVETTPASR